MTKINVLHWSDKSGKGGPIRVYEDWHDAMDEAQRLEDEDVLGRTYFVDEVPFVAKRQDYARRAAA